MSKKQMITVDGNEACAWVAFRANEIAAIYPITPSSTMAELAEQWAAEGKKNLWGSIPEITEMQSEGGAAGAVHGAIQAGALGTTFTASQGLLLMIPNMYKIAGELTPFVMHVSARTLATHALSIFGDHSDVMACRQTGFAMLAGASVQEAQDLAAIAQASTLRSRVPFLHFFDGFRTSHEVAKIELLTDEQLREMIDEDLIVKYRERALTPDHPVVRGTAQNPDTFFQAQEARNPYYDVLPGIVQEEMDRFARITGRQYKLFDYVGHPEATEVIIVMGSGGETAEITAAQLNKQGRKVGVLKVRLYRPFSIDALVAALPASVRSIAVLDRCKEPGSLGEPLYLDVVAGLVEARAAGQRVSASDPRVIGGRFGLSSKEFTPVMVKAIYDELQKDKPKPHFTIGINDDVTGLSLALDPNFHLDTGDWKAAVFYGLGADGTVGANKNSIKIVADHTDLYAQGYFVYDSKKSNGLTVSHLRFSASPIKAPFLVQRAGFVACHNFVFMEKYDVLHYAAKGATFLINSPYPASEVWDKLARPVQQQIIEKELKVYVIDARSVAQAAGMGGRINTVMQVCYFALANTLPKDEAIGYIKKAIQKSYGRKSQAVVEKNYAAVDQALAHLIELKVPAQVSSTHDLPPIVPKNAPDFVQRVTALMLADKGDLLPVSAFPVDGTWPVGTAKYEKRNIAGAIPAWEQSLCIQCNKCVMICPHAAIRAKAVQPDAMADAPASLKSMPYKGPEVKGGTYVLQVAPEDCTGCTLCVHVCPGKDKADPNRFALAMVDKEPIFEAEKTNFDFFLSLPDLDRADVRLNMKTTQLITPLFEFSGACLACGETPYVKTVTQLFGDRTMIANATGCSSIYGGNLPTTPYTTDRDGRGPAWANSLFEDNAEFGLGYRLAVDHHKRHAQELIKRLTGQIPEQLANELLYSPQNTDAGIKAQRARVAELRRLLASHKDAESVRLDLLADYLVDKVIWIVGGDGWAYDIGYGGLDHVLASGRNVNILVMDTEAYSNTGGQASKSTPLGATAKFATTGKTRPKKDMGLIAMSYGNVYVASVAFGAKDAQTVMAMQEAAAYDGVSLIIAYAHCIAHGNDLSHGLDQQKLAVQTGYWPLYRYDPRKLGTGESPLSLDAADPNMQVCDYMASETRFRITEKLNPEHYKQLVESANEEVRRRFHILKRMAGDAAAE
ncbi:pyruvate:ferredoxin (flavodoxin) oxidoreductase [Telmatospirillum siberiense]|uniref:Pyruvate-flavodoxin oxidoreductase n=1 Tax=Telmatospirillum siberiense TaxID=382514 RepID=A0A2N3PP99_9PROT|nr:pyruvate:ferredoxin (flavodoxin) oxidoreductase [Telmatospirillum siberiense]PKU22217.1 pyruvate:ferredoxin (flavodoxin) oxidoreductase [Telmatospirillum siberiense]